MYIADGTTERERLSVLDASNLRIEDAGLPMHVAALLILDQLPPGSPAAEPGVAAVRAAVAQWLPRVPRLRQVLSPLPPGNKTFGWAADPDFDIRGHVRARSVPPPGDESALLALCTQLNEQRLDRSRPLWEVWLLTGLADGRAAVLIRLHHVMADGMAAVTMMDALFEPEPQPAPVDLEPRPAGAGSLSPRAGDPAPAPEPGGARWPGPRPPARPAMSLAATGRHVTGLRRLAALPGQGARLTREGRAPRLSLNQRIGPHRRLLLIRADLERARAAGHAQGGTVNDVVLAAVAGGMRGLLAGRAELVPDMVVKASVAVSLRRPGYQPAAGNQVGVMIVPLPAGEADPGRCLGQIARATAERKRRPPYQPNARFLQRWMARAMARQRLVNVLVSNLPGPSGPRYFAGARITEIFQIGVVQGNVTVSTGVLSYAGQLNFAVLADRDAVPDLDAFGTGARATLGQLGALPRGRHRPPVSRTGWRLPTRME